MQSTFYNQSQHYFFMKTNAFLAHNKIMKRQYTLFHLKAKALINKTILQLAL